MAEFLLGETPNQLIYKMKVASYFCESFYLVFISLGIKFHNATQVNIMSSTCCIIVTGMVIFKILKSLIQVTALSTCASSFVFLTLDFIFWFFFLARGGTTNLQKKK